MSKWSVEMAYGVNICVDVEANTQQEAVKLAKKVVDEDVNISDDRNIDSGGLIFEQVTGVYEKTATSL